jgi:hypothetical protein
MARCDQGYLCDVCGREVEDITESDLYLAYVLGSVKPERLHLEPERHLRCNPARAQFIVEARFPPVVCAGPLAKAELDAEYVAAEERRITRAWQRLQEVRALHLSIDEYPLPELRAT